VPATLSLTMGAPASFGAFLPGVGREYTASTTANVISSAADATLSVSEPGHLMNGTFSLASPLQVEFGKTSWTEPVSNESVPVTFKQTISSGEALRTGNYTKTLTFTLSTTTP
jgi:amidase